MNKKSIYFILSWVLLISACSSERNTFTNRLYHNTTAKYNAYYLAKEKILELEAEIKNTHQEDYSQVLPIFYPIDSSIVEKNVELLKETREFASKAIDWHRISKWVDDSYFLMGMADYYEANFDESTNTFKYLNVNSKDKHLRHQSLIQLLRLFVDLGKFDDAAFVIDFLSKEKGINQENLFNLYKTLAYYYHQRDEINGKIGALDKAVEYAKDKKEKSRINFILAQLYQKEGLDALAYSYYRESEKGNPPYERSFFAQLYAQQVAELNKSKDLRKVRAYYDNLYKDSKNVDLRDVILYEKALFELKQENNIEEAERLLTKAAKETGKTQIQKGYIYEKLAQIRFDLKKDYKAAKYYLDSALVYFKATDPSYNTIAMRKEVLDNYVTHFETISKNDSLIALSQLGPEEQEQIAENYIKKEEQRLIQLAEEKNKPKSTGIFDNLLAFSSRGSTDNFYFSNAVARQQGAIDFFKNWGNRPLQDNWRRNSQGFQNIAVEDETIIDQNNTNDSETEIEEGQPLMEIPDKETLLLQIPKTKEALDMLKKELETAYFEMGKLLIFDLKEPELSISYLESLIKDYPNTVKKPEAYYLLYLANEEIGGNAEFYAQKLNAEFPDSQFTFSINNPKGSSDNMAYLESSKGYKEAYEKYYSRQYQEAKSIIRSTLESFPLTRNTEKLLLLDIMVSGKLDSRERFQSRLENYIQNTESPELVKMARNMLSALTGEKPQESNTETLAAEDSISEKNEESVSDKSEEEQEVSVYKENLNQTHIFVIVLESQKAKEAKGLLADLENFHAQNFSNSRLRTGNMNLNRENTIFIISPFNNAEKALAYREKFMEELKTDALSSEDKNDSFLISIENFQELNKNKNIEEYRAFYKKTYNK